MPTTEFDPIIREKTDNTLEIIDRLQNAIACYRATYKSSKLTDCFGWWWHSSTTNINGWSAGTAFDGYLQLNANVTSQSPVTGLMPGMSTFPMASDYRYFNIRFKTSTGSRLKVSFLQHSVMSTPTDFFEVVVGDNGWGTVSVDMKGFADAWSTQQIRRVSVVCDRVVQIAYILISRDQYSILPTKIPEAWSLNPLLPYSLDDLTENEHFNQLDVNLIEDLREKISVVRQASWTPIKANKSTNSFDVISELRFNMSQTEKTNYGWEGNAGCEQHTCGCDSTCVEHTACTCHNICNTDNICSCNTVYNASQCRCDAESYSDCTCNDSSHSTCGCDVGKHTCSCEACDSFSCRCEPTSHTCSCEACDTYVACPCDGPCDRYSCNCYQKTFEGCSVAYGCSCYSKQYDKEVICTCNGGCYVGVSCTCNKACDQYDSECYCDSSCVEQGSCGCYSGCHSQGSCGCDTGCHSGYDAGCDPYSCGCEGACDETCYGYCGCDSSCNAACDSDDPCNCDGSCDRDSCDCHNPCDFDNTCGEACDLDICGCDVRCHKDF